MEYETSTPPSSPTLPQQCLDAPVKKSLMLTKEVIFLNMSLFLSAMGVFVLLSFLSALAPFSIFSAVALGLLVFSMQITLGRLFWDHQDMDAFVEEIRALDLKTLFLKHISPALGAYAGWMVLLILPAALWGVALAQADRGQVGALFLVFAIIALIATYVQPLVSANIIRSDTFKEGFGAVFTLFSPQTWKEALKGAYFKYMLTLGLIVFVFFFLIGFIIALFSGIGLASEIRLLINGILTFILGVLSTFIAVIGKTIVRHA